MVGGTWVHSVSVQSPQLVAGAQVLRLQQCSHTPVSAMGGHMSDWSLQPPFEGPCVHTYGCVLPAHPHGQGGTVHRQPILQR